MKQVSPEEYGKCHENLLPNFFPSQDDRGLLGLKVLLYSGSWSTALGHLLLTIGQVLPRNPNLTFVQVPNSEAHKCAITFGIINKTAHLQLYLPLSLQPLASPVSQETKSDDDTKGEIGNEESQEEKKKNKKNQKAKDKKREKGKGKHKEVKEKERKGKEKQREMKEKKEQDVRPRNKGTSTDMTEPGDIFMEYGDPRLLAIMSQSNMSQLLRPIMKMVTSLSCDEFGEEGISTLDPRDVYGLVTFISAQIVNPRIRAAVQNRKYLDNCLRMMDHEAYHIIDSLTLEELQRRRDVRNEWLFKEHEHITSDEALEFGHRKLQRDVDAKYEDYLEELENEGH